MLLIFYQQGGFIGLINSLFVCVVYMRKEETTGLFCCAGLSIMCVCVCVYAVVDE